ncbi:hypothetical protein MRB53_021076 [Persea americana]|uniref:Uncharacterized protein n=1 Tax=Persea americana TaxID=3435 RepID=A0ACC2L2V5_PERAE|nr:hypothetical protein MRB53_021076 [Persea americana]
MPSSLPSPSHLILSSTNPWHVPLPLLVSGAGSNLLSLFLISQNRKILKSFPLSPLHAQQISIVISGLGSLYLQHSLCSPGLHGFYFWSERAGYHESTKMTVHLPTEAEDSTISHFSKSSGRRSLKVLDAMNQHPHLHRNNQQSSGHSPTIYVDLRVRDL